MEPASNTRRHVVFGLAMLALLIGGLGGWSVYARIASAVVAEGIIAVEGNRQIVQHPTGGVVAEIAARDGDRVEEGELLLRLDGARLVAELAIANGQFYELLARKGRLIAERDGSRSVTFDGELVAVRVDPTPAAAMAAEIVQFEVRRQSFDGELEQLAERRIQISHQIEGLAALGLSAESQLDLIAIEIASQEALSARGLTVQARLHAPQRERARLQGVMGQVAAQNAENRARIAEIELERLRLATRRREEAIADLRAISERELEPRERRRHLRDEIDRLEIRAPASGIVYGSRADTMRAVIRPAEPIMFIVPEEAPLIVRTRVAPVEIDRVAAGQPARLRFPVFGAGRTPEVDGMVSAISADVIIDDADAAPYYRVDIAMPTEQQARLGRTLLPGMPVEALVTAEARAPLDYFVRPLLDYFGRALRED